MPVSPVTPEEFCENVITGNERACDAFQKIKNNSVLMCRFFEWAIPILEEGGTTPGESGLAAPQNVTASTDRETDITVTWSAVTGATMYDVYRGLDASTSTMTLISSGQSDRTYVDTGAVENEVTWYAIKARNSTQVSAFSSAASGIMPVEQSPGIGPPISHGNPTEFPVIVPAGVTTMEVLLWGAGGNGGAAPPFGGVGTYARGGGGASGSFMRVTGIPVTQGETYVLVPGAYVVDGEDHDGSPASFVYRDSVESDEYVMAPAGGHGGRPSTATIGGSGGVPGPDGENTMGGGSVTEIESGPGNAGEAGTGQPPAGGAGGIAVSYGGLTTEGQGKEGTNLALADNNQGSNPQYGYARIIWHA